MVFSCSSQTAYVCWALEEFFYGFTPKKDKPMIRCALLLIVFFAAAMTTNVLAQDLPRYNVETYCERAGKLWYTAELNECIYKEQQYYDDLMRRWPEFEAGFRSKCIAHFEERLQVKRKPQSYRELRECIELAMKVPEPIRQFMY